ncbi:MAG: hypothetical protein HQK90_15260 [Nitrospirae bacterium]|nr:hypothetical protein [Nitrospirota bacterium]
MFYLIIGLQLSVLIWLIQRKNIKKYLRIGFIFLVIISIVILFKINADTQPNTLGNNEWYNASPYKEIILLVFLLFGIFTRYLTQQIENRSKKISKLRIKYKDSEFVKPKIEFDFYEFSYPFLSSVVTIFLMLERIGTKDGYIQ